MKINIKPRIRSQDDFLSQFDEMIPDVSLDLVKGTEIEMHYVFSLYTYVNDIFPRMGYPLHIIDPVYQYNFCVINDFCRYANFTGNIETKEYDIPSIGPDKKRYFYNRTTRFSFLNGKLHNESGLAYCQKVLDRKNNDFQGWKGSHSIDGIIYRNMDELKKKLLEYYYKTEQITQEEIIMELL